MCWTGTVEPPALKPLGYSVRATCGVAQLAAGCSPTQARVRYSVQRQPQSVIGILLPLRVYAANTHAVSVHAASAPPQSEHCAGFSCLSAFFPV